MSRAFIRTIWGSPDYFPPDRQWRWSRMWDEVEFALQNEFLPANSFKVYCFGVDNFDRLKALGATAICCDPQPHLWGAERNYRNRFHLLQAAMLDHDEIVSLDWDTYPVKQIPADFWDRRQKGARFQASLIRYKKCFCSWRTSDQKVFPNGAMFYVRGAYTLDEIVKIYDTDPLFADNPSDEYVFARWVDGRLKGWKGAETWCRKGLELDCFDSARRSTTTDGVQWVAGAPPAVVAAKDIVFVHHHQPATESTK